MSETILTGPYLIPSEDVNNYSETVLHIEGGYVGETAPGGNAGIWRGETGGYANVNTVNAPNLPILSQVGSFIQNNLLLMVGIGAVLLLTSGRRR